MKSMQKTEKSEDLISAVHSTQDMDCVEGSQSLLLQKL